MDIIVFLILAVGLIYKLIHLILMISKVIREGKNLDNEDKEEKE